MCSKQHTEMVILLDDGMSSINHPVRLPQRQQQWQQTCWKLGGIMTSGAHGHLGAEIRAVNEAKRVVILIQFVQNTETCSMLTMFFSMPCVQKKKSFGHKRWQPQCGRGWWGCNHNTPESGTFTARGCRHTRPSRQTAPSTPRPLT